MNKKDRLEKLLLREEVMGPRVLPYRARIRRDLRRQVVQAANDLYEKGDTVESLRAKILDRIGSDTPWLDLLNKILDALLPILIQLLVSLI